MRGSNISAFGGGGIGVIVVDALKGDFRFSDCWLSRLLIVDRRQSFPNMFSSVLLALPAHRNCGDLTSDFDDVGVVKISCFFVVVVVVLAALNGLDSNDDKSPNESSSSAPSPSSFSFLLVVFVVVVFVDVVKLLNFLVTGLNILSISRSRRIRSIYAFLNLFFTFARAVVRSDKSFRFVGDENAKDDGESFITFTDAFLVFFIFSTVV